MQFYAVYVLACDANDQYSLMTQVSIRSLKIFNPEVYVCLITDEKTLSNLNQQGDQLLGIVNQIVSIDVPYKDKKVISRFLKTSMRSLVDFPFIFLDSDTLIRKNIAEIFETDCDVAACVNHSKTELSDQLFSTDLKAIHSINIFPDFKYYINTGVIFFNNTDRAFRLGTKWNNIWNEYYLESNEYRDQGAFNAALATETCNFHILDSRYNAQFKSNNLVGYNASIWHYYSSTTILPRTAIEVYIFGHKPNSILSDSVIKRIAMNFHPWRNDIPFLDNLYGIYLIRKPRLNEFDYLWTVGQRLRAVVKIFIDLIKKIKNYKFP